jgi:hypothetical protein
MHWDWMRGHVPTAGHWRTTEIRLAGTHSVVVHVCLAHCANALVILLDKRENTLRIELDVGISPLEMMHVDICHFGDSGLMTFARMT